MIRLCPDPNDLTVRNTSTTVLVPCRVFVSFKPHLSWDSVAFDPNGGLGVKARQLLDGNLSGFPDETIRIMHAALDKAWTMLPSRYHEPTLVERAAFCSRVRSST